MTKAISEPVTPGAAIGETASRGAQQAVDHPGLAADLGRHPAGDHRDEAGRPHDQREAVQPAPVVELAAQPREQAPQAEPEHQEAEPDHDPERPEDDRDRRLILQRHRVEPAHRRVRIMLQQQRAELRDLDRETHGLRRLVRQAEQDTSGAPSGWLWKWPSIAMIFTG